MQHSGDYNSFRLIIVFSMFLGYVLEVEWLCCINMEWPGFVLKYTISDSMVPHPHESEVIFLLVIRFGSSFSLWFHHKFVPYKPGHQPGNQRIMICYSKCYPFANQTDQGSASIPDRSSEPPRPVLDAMGPPLHWAIACGAKFQVVSTGFNRWLKSPCGSWGAKHLTTAGVITPAKICSDHLRKL